MNKKAQASGLGGLFTSVVTISAFTIFCIIFIQSGSTRYDFSYNDTEFSAFDKSVSINELTLETQQVVTGANSTGAGSTSNIELVTGSGYKSFRLISETPVILGGLFNSIATALGIPMSIVVLAIAMITITIISIIILLVFRVNVL